MVLNNASKRDSTQSTATFASLRSSWRSSSCHHVSDESLPMAAQPSQSGTMAAAAQAAQGRRQVNLKRQMSQTSLRSVGSSLTTISSTSQRQPRNSFNAAMDRSKELSRSSRVDSNGSKRSSLKAPVRRCETAMRSGRHSNEWVFGGWSFRETVKSLLK